MMRSSSEQYTIAWFTLAECVSRGERERAFGVYRLLSHSLDDRALAAQLEGDLCYAFKMPPQAVEQYQMAIRLYKQSGRLLEAASVCEHIRTIDAQNVQNSVELFELYCLLQFDVRLREVAGMVAVQLIQQELYDTLWGLVSIIEKLNSYGVRAHCYVAMSSALHNQDKEAKHAVQFFAQHAVRAYMKHGDDTSLQQFITKIKALDDVIYQALIPIIRGTSI